MAGQTPDNLRYTREHEWVDITPEGRARFGITDHAQDALGDIVFVTLPAVGTVEATLALRQQGFALVRVLDTSGAPVTDRASSRR